MEVLRTPEFDRWLQKLADDLAFAQVVRRLQRLQSGNAGDAKLVGDGVLELRIDVGPGYRVYYARKGRELLLILLGGDKSSQTRDISRAKRIAREWEAGDGA